MPTQQTDGNKMIFENAPCFFALISDAIIRNDAGN